ncbi:MAG: ATP-dependent RNA helicase HrpA [Ornithinimicrobium sp.]
MSESTRRSRPRRARSSASDTEARRAAVPSRIPYPQDLPVVARKSDLLDVIGAHQVVIVAGETGSGKTTQIPKMCLELGRGIEGTIGHTQPRRIAARAVAERISEELGVELGTTVGYQVRFTDRSRHDTLVKVMTDGILLSELHRDKDLSKYDTLIIDEAHERSLNIDFILGYLRQLLPRRPDLKVVITSATIDVERFAEHFAGPDGTPAPIVEVSGRTYPVRVAYRPLTRPGPPAKDGSPTDVEIDQVGGICDAVEELWTHPSASDGGPQDILVFCSGEREIRDACDALAGLGLGDTQILPLYGRLSASEQHQVFSRHGGRRIVVASNVAETSLTVPGIRYVVDSGTARISRYSQRLKVQRLPIEPISQASSNQRSGRCGRVADGIAIRLYAEDDFENRPEFTDPEIVRTNLASVILAMTDLGLGRIERFPFLQPPDSRQIADGVRLLEELQAIDPDAPAHIPRKRLTAYGKAIVALPVDPRLARMLVEADRNGALAEVLVIASALSIQDPRERPSDKQAQADQQHARFKDDDSDFITLLNLWNYLQKQQKALSGSAFRRMCKREYLHYLRVREWQDLHTQVRRATKSLGLSLNSSPATPDQVHQSLVPGLLSLVGLYDRDKREYVGARNAKFHLQPGSTLHRKNPDWVMTAELVETTRLWARVNARVDPSWIESAAAHLVKRSYAEPRWSRKRGSAVANERVTLYGVPLVAGRPVALGKIEPQTSRDLFIRHALVEGDWDNRHEFLRHNRALLGEVSDLEARARRRNIVVDDETLVDFYDQRVPSQVVSGAHFDRWWKKAARSEPELLTFTEDLLVAGDGVSDRDFPGSWTYRDLELALTYHFEPGAADDGMSVHVPLEVLNRVDASGFDWHVPGMREELVIALIKSLPKDLRRNYVPAPDHARAALRRMHPDQGPIATALALALSSVGPARVRPTDMDWDRVPGHLKPTFVVERARSRGTGSQPGTAATEELGSGKDLSVLQAQLAPAVRSSMAAAASSIERTGLSTWDFGTLATTFEQRVGGRTVQGFPALVDTGNAVDIRVVATRAEADRATAIGVRRLLLLATSPPWKRVLALLDNQQKLSLGHNPHGSVPSLLEDVLAAAVDSIIAAMPDGGVRTASDFDAAVATVRQQSTPKVLDIVGTVAPVLDQARVLSNRLDRLSTAAARPLKEDVQRQLSSLIRPGFVAATGYRRLPRLLVYLRAMGERLDKGVQDLARDAERMEQVQVVREELDALLRNLPPHRRLDDDVVEIGWQIEELRVSLFAQRLGTPAPVSPQRIYAAMDRVEGRAGG